MALTHGREPDEAPLVEIRARTALRAQVTWAVCCLVVPVAALLFVNAVPAVGWPLLVAGSSAYLLDPLVTRMTRLGLSRGTATALLYTAFLAIAGLAMVLLVPLLVAQAARLPAYLDHLRLMATPWLEARLGHAVPTDVRALTAMAGTSVEELLAGALPTAGGLVGMLVGGSLSLLAGLLVVPVVGFTLLGRWPELRAFVARHVPPAQRGVFSAGAREVDAMLGGFVRGQLFMATLLSCLYAGALSLVGVRLAVVVGLVTGIGNLVPYLGTATGLALAIVSCLVDFGADVHALLVVAAFGIVATLDSLVLTPRIVGDRVGLPPAAVIVVVMLGGTLFGFAGVLLAIPLGAIARLSFAALLDAWRRSEAFRRE
jgi:predicted PurR-regulated permease PerM